MMYQRFSLVLALLALLVAGCKPDKVDPIAPPPPTNEQELITTVIVTFTDPEDVADEFTFTFRDLDGEGGNAPTVEVDTLPTGRAFSMRITLLDETNSPPTDISVEVGNEAAEHQFFFGTGDADMTILYGDQDGNGNPLGLVNTAITGVAGSGVLTVILRHELDKQAQGVAQGDITNAGGDTDVEVNFPLHIW